MTSFHINPALNPDALNTVWRHDRRVRIHDFLMSGGAERLRAHLAGRQDWRQVLNSDDKFFELDRQTRRDMDPEHAAALEEAVIVGARTGFQYRYESLRVPDGVAARDDGGDVLTEFARWLSGEEVLAFLHRVTGARDVTFADTQATAYAPGDFLTRHDDDVPGKDRRAAYVFGLSPQWRPEWGGLLLFHDDDRLVGLSPGFNTLDLLAVPQPHSVSMVTRAPPNRRYSVTGWLRAQPQPA